MEGEFETVYTGGMEASRKGKTDCIFCQIAAQETPAEVVWEDELTIFFHDISPKAAVHVVGIPKQHLESMAVRDEATTVIIGRLMLNAALVAEKLDVSESGYRLIVNVGRDAGQEIKHLHWHLLGGEALGKMVER